MKIEGKKLHIQRVEIVKRVFNSKGNIVREEWQYFFPSEIEQEIGFKLKRK